MKEADTDKDNFINKEEFEEVQYINKCGIKCVEVG